MSTVVTVEESVTLLEMSTGTIIEIDNGIIVQFAQMGPQGPPGEDGSASSGGYPALLGYMGY